MNDFLFRVAEVLSRPPGFYGMLVLMAAGTLLVPFGYTGLVTYVLSVLAILVTGVVLIQGYRGYSGDSRQAGRDYRRSVRNAE
jgi:low affinity Fe/Cu permease